MRPAVRFPRKLTFITASFSRPSPPLFYVIHGFELSRNVGPTKRRVFGSSRCEAESFRESGVASGEFSGIRGGKRRVFGNPGEGTCTNWVLNRSTPNLTLPFKSAHNAAQSPAAL